MKLPMYVEPDVCGPCGGKCCKGMPGIASPEDFGGDFAAIEAAIATGRWALDCWDEDSELPETYYLRPATEKARGEIVDRSWGGRCNFLKATGCELAPDVRPQNCRDLKPNRESPGNCTMPNGLNKLDYVKMWCPHQRALKVIIANLRQERAA